MSTATIQRQYDELIAEHYDLDPQSLASDTLDHVLEQLEDAECLSERHSPMRVLDVGMGTGLFYEKLRSTTQRVVAPYGLDISARMLDIALRRIPNLQAVVGDAADLHRHFSEQSFDLICTHFITGFVPIAELAPKIWSQLKPGGYWSFVGATSNAYPTLQKKASSKLVQLLLRNRSLEMSELITPSDQDEVQQVFDDHNFDICASETLVPELEFRNFDEFMEFAYDGGWLTPFIEDLDLQNAHAALRLLLNTFVFPVKDHHTIVVGLARKPVD